MLSKKIRKDILYKQLDSLLKPMGFKLFNTGLDPQYTQKRNDTIIWISMNFLDAGSVSIELLVTINEIEDIILDIGVPYKKNMNLYLAKKKYFLATFRDQILHKKMKDDYHLYGFKTEQEMIEFSESISNHLSTIGLRYIDHYSFLPNLLFKMKELEKQGRYPKEILEGRADWLFRSLIISKLCNDTAFNEKLRWSDEIFSDNQNNMLEWAPYYSKLKVKLETIEPKYEASDGIVLDGNKII